MIHTFFFQLFCSFFFFNDTATTEIYTLSLHDALPICRSRAVRPASTPRHRCARVGSSRACSGSSTSSRRHRSEEHTSELQSLAYLVCRLLLEKKKKEEVYVLCTMHIYCPDGMKCEFIA